MKPDPAPLQEWTPFSSLARRRTSGFGLMDWMLLVVLLGGGLWFGVRAVEVARYEWQWPILLDFVARQRAGSWEPGLLLRGLAVTLRLGVWAMLLAVCIGGCMGLGAARAPRAVRVPIWCYVNLVRNTPPLILLFLIYFMAGTLVPMAEIEAYIHALPLNVQALIHLIIAPPEQLDRMLAAVLTLGIYEGAYVTEIVRGAVENVPRGQWEASSALGLSGVQRMRLVILPQASRMMAPPMVGQVISTFKDSALASLISLPELTFQSLEVMAVSRMTFEVWGTTALLYLAIGGVCALLGRWWERRAPQSGMRR